MALKKIHCCSGKSSCLSSIPFSTSALCSTEEAHTVKFWWNWNMKIIAILNIYFQTFLFGGTQWEFSNVKIWAVAKKSCTRSMGTSYLLWHQTWPKTRDQRLDQSRETRERIWNISIIQNRQYLCLLNKTKLSFIKICYHQMIRLPHVCLYL